MPAELSAQMASAFANITLGHVSREYPHAMVHVMRGPGDYVSPSSVHPIFYGSFDWHSSVHAFWQLARLRRLFPDLTQATEIDALFDGRITPSNVATELRYFQRPESNSFERPYGWAWLLMLAAELHQHRTPIMQSACRAILPLSQMLATRLSEFLSKATYPIRAGVHSNTAFALTLASDYASIVADHVLAEQIKSTVKRWYGNDTNCAAWEPSQDDFLSPALMEAECMRRALDGDDFIRWFQTFLPNVRHRQPHTLFEPAFVSDRTDGKIAHLDGLNLSRAWCWRGIARGLRDDDPSKSIALATAQSHLLASLPHLSGDYAGEHWLASFALLAMSS